MARFRKAVAAAVAAGLVPVVIAIVGEFAPGLNLSLVETVLLAVVGVIVAGPVVYRVPNAPEGS